LYTNDLPGPPILARAHRRARVIDTDTLRITLVSRETSDCQECEQNSEDNPNVDAHQRSPAYAHKFAGLASPTDDELVKATVRGIRRTLGTAKIKKVPATAERLLAMAANTGANLKGLRDRASLLIGFAGALRRSELVAPTIEDIEEAPDGMKIAIRHSKTDQEGAGQTIAIPLGEIACPVAALKEWITAAGISSGALFRSVNRHGKVGERLSA
jgi:integrase